MSEQDKKETIKPTVIKPTLELVSEEENSGKKFRVWHRPEGGVFFYHRFHSWERDEFESLQEKDERTGELEDKSFWDVVIQKGLNRWEDVCVDGKDVPVNLDMIHALPTGVKRELFDKIYSGSGGTQGDPFVK